MSKSSKGRKPNNGLATRAQQQNPTGANRSLRAGHDGQRTVVEYIEGPLPAPATLAQYEAICPGAAERIIRMAERQSEHRQTLEAQVVPAAISAERRGQHYGLAVALVGLAVALVLGLTGHQLAAGLIGGGGLVSLAGVFVYGRRSQERERSANRD